MAVIWTQHTMPITIEGFFANFTFAGGKFLLVDGDEALTSPDGESWSHNTHGESLGSGYKPPLLFDGVRYCSTSFDDFHVSTDGLTWDSGVDTGASDVHTITGLAKNSSLYVAAPGSDSAGTSPCAIARTSPDRTVWTDRALPSAVFGAQVYWNGTVFCVTGDTTTPYEKVSFTSSNGTTWSSHTIPNVGSAWYGFIWTGTVFCLTGVGEVITSPDGVTWTSHDLPSSNNYEVWHNGSVFFYYDDDLRIHYSRNLISWTSMDLPFMDPGDYFLFANDGRRTVAIKQYVSSDQAYVFYFEDFWTGRINTVET